MRRVLAAVVLLAGASAQAEIPSATRSATATATAANTTAAPAAGVAPVTAEPGAATPAAPAAPAAAPATTPAASAAAAPARAKKRRKKTPPAPPPPAAELVAINTHEVFHLRPDGHGRFTRAALHGWNRFLRCHHTGRVHAMSTRLAGLIYEVAQHFGFRRIEVVAGYRAPRIAREKGNPKSPHKKGVACDFRIDGVANTELRDYERTLPHVGVGYYPNSEFVHLDCDPLRNKHSAFWIDYSRPGERARYSKNPEADLESEEDRMAEAPSEPTDFIAPGLNAPSPLAAPAPSSPAFGGTEPQAPLIKGAGAPSGSPPIFPLPENH